MDSFISYEGLPISHGGAHEISSKPVDFIYEQVTLFIESYTIEKKRPNVFFVTNNITLSEFWRYTIMFGLPSFDFRWKVSKQKVRTAIRLLSQDEGTGIDITWKFHFIDSVSKQVLKGQNQIPVFDERVFNSQIYLRLSKTKSTISVWFAFPFEDLSQKSLQYIAGIKRILPFKFSKQTWRLWKLSAKKNWTPSIIEVDD